MKKKRKLIAAGAILALIALLGLRWYWQAKYAEHLIMFHVPDWIMRNSDPDVSYSVAIGKSQIHPYGTLWKATYYRNAITNFPQN